MPFDRVHYEWPNCEEAEFWLPPPCERPEGHQNRKRFARLVKNIITSRFAEVGGLPYTIVDVQLTTFLSCRTLSPCTYTVTFSLGPMYTQTLDLKRGINDLRMFAPRGVQLIKKVKFDEDLDPELPPRTVIAAQYVVNCARNVRYRGNCQHLRGRAPRVAVDAARLQVVNAVPAAPLQLLQRDAYDLPDLPESEWWLPPACQLPVTAAGRDRFRKLLKYMIQNRLIREATLHYDIISLAVIPSLSCRSLTKCIYQVQFNLGANFRRMEDIKRAVHDLTMFAPRGVQIIEECRAVQQIVEDTGSSSSSGPEDQPPKYLSADYTCHCQHNVRWRGNSNLQQERYTKVRL